MATRQKPKTQPGEYKPSKVLPIDVLEGASHEEQAKAVANSIASPELAAYRVIGMLQPKYLADEIDASGMLVSLRDKAAAINRGDLSHAEAMLINQAEALQSIFVRLMERGTEQTLMPNIEGFMRLALRAQSQCRATLETLAAIKNPPIVYARQANFANGPQQVNNGVTEQSAHGPAHAGEKHIQQSKLLKHQHGTYLDIGTAGTAAEADSAMATVGEIDRAQVGRGKSHGFAERI